MKKRRLFDLGKMRHRVEIHDITRTEDDSGGFDRGDPSAASLLGEVWCHIQPISAKEKEWGGQFTELTSHVAWLRYNTSLSEGQTLRYVQVNGGPIDYYVETLFDPDRTKQFHILGLREGGPL